MLIRTVGLASTFLVGAPRTARGNAGLCELRYHARICVDISRASITLKVLSSCAQCRRTAFQEP